MTAIQLLLLITLQLVVSLILFAVTITLLIFISKKFLSRYREIDNKIFDRLQRFPNATRNRLMVWITSLGKAEFLIPANLLLIFYFLWIARLTWLSIRVLAISLSSLVLMSILKWLFGRQRPLSPLLKAARGLSFPSGHAIMSVAFFGLIIYWIVHAGIAQWIVIITVSLLLLLILLIGFSRVYLRVHYASDVLAGFIIGLIWLLIALAVVAEAEAYSLAVLTTGVHHLITGISLLSPIC